MTIEVAPILFQLTPVVAKKLRVPTGSGFVSRPLNTIGKMALFQLKTKANMAETIIPGNEIGSTTLQSALSRLAPSTMAASSKDGGTSSKKLFMMSTEKGIVKVWKINIMD